MMANAAQQQSLAANTINNLLTNPRPGGAPALPGMGGTVVGGLAGVASTFKGRGILRYNDQDEYQKWEFYYDLSGELNGAARGLQQIPQPSTTGGTGSSTASPFQTPTPSSTPMPFAK
jgi:hypothetical protein